MYISLIQKVMWIQEGQGLLKPVRADQSQKTGLFRDEGLKETGA